MSVEQQDLPGVAISIWRHREQQITNRRVALQEQLDALHGKHTYLYEQVRVVEREMFEIECQLNDLEFQ